MKTMRGISRLIGGLVGLAILGMAGTASAVPFTYRFDMPAFTNFPLAGETSILDVTVDNGNASSINQSYLNTQITGFSVKVGALSISLDVAVDMSDFEGSIPYITTDGLGVPTLDLSADIDTRAQLFAGATCCSNGVQLGTRDGSGPIEYFVGINDDLGANTNELIVVGRRVVTAPEPASLALFLIALGGLGVLARRRSAR